MNAQENDESLLIGFVFGKLEPDEKAAVGQKLADDEDLRRLHRDIMNTADALRALPEHEPPSDLVANTFKRIAQARQTDALIAREEVGRGVVRPTFSLRELLAVAATVLIAISLFVPSVRQARRVAHIGQCSSNMGQIGTALLSYANSNNGRLPAAAGVGGHWIAGDRRALSNSSALYRLVEQKYVPQTVFLCPAGGRGKTFQLTSNLSDFPSARNINYSYQHTVGPRDLNYTHPDLAGVKSRMVILADSTPFFRNGQLQIEPGQSASENHNRTGQNVLFLDMHVQWASQSQAGVDGDDIFLAEGVYKYRGDETPSSPTDTFLLPAFSGSDKR